MGSVPMQEDAGLGEAGLDREETLGPFLEAHWRFPIPPQGDPPEGSSALEAALDPASCGACHPKQLAEWEGTLHAGAFSPGFAGQLIEGGLAAPQSLRHCQTCHTPLAEQQPVLADGTPSPHFDPGLREQGMVCATCHVREHVRYGPPRRAELPPPPEVVPHAGFEVREEFEQSRFCAQCHQFFGQRGPSGRPVQNTFVEWQASPHAAAGETCQSCHMPDRAHLWRGIHDAETVRAATETTLTVIAANDEAVEAELVFTSKGIGHMLPTYTTPRIFMRIAQVDRDGEELPGTEETFTVGREVDFEKMEDVLDTRIPPGESATLRYSKARAEGATALVGRVTADPDFHYRGVFASYLPTLEDPTAKRLIAEALRRASESVYVVEEVRLRL